MPLHAREGALRAQNSCRLMRLEIFRRFGISASRSQVRLRQCRKGIGNALVLRLWDSWFAAAAYAVAKVIKATRTPAAAIPPRRTSRQRRAICERAEQTCRRAAAPDQHAFLPRFGKLTHFRPTALWITALNSK